MLGERRAGCDPINLTGAGFNGTGAITVNAASSTTWGVIGVTLAPNGVITAGNAATGNFSTSVSSYTAAYVVNASSNYLVVCVVGDSTTDKVTGVTYNAVSMTQLSKLNAGATLGWIYVYGLAAPATGSHNVVISASGSCSTLGFVAADYLAIKASGEPDSSLTQTMASSLSVTTNYTPVAANTWAIQFSINGQGAQTSIASGALRVFASVGGTLPTLTWTGTTSGSQNYNSVTTPVVFNHAGGGSWTLTVANGNLSLTFQGTAGGGGGSGGLGAGGGGGATTTGTSVTLVPGKSYTLAVGGGGAANTGGGNTTLINTTDTVTLVSLTGGAKGNNGAGAAGGAGGALVTGTNGITGGNGGPAASVANGPGGGGVTATNGAGGGGGGGAFDGGAGAAGGAGSVPGGAGGSRASGGNSSGFGGGDGIGDGGSSDPGPNSGGGGGGGGAKFGVSGESSNGAGGGGGGGGSTDSGSAGAGGAGGDGIGAFSFVGSNFSVTLADSNGPLAAQTAIVELSEWFPLGDQYNSELWAIAASPNTSQSVLLARRSTLSTGSYVWSQVVPSDPIISLAPDVYLINSQPLDGLFFWAYNSGIDRLHVWEPNTSTLRRTGLAQPNAAPTAANAGSGSLTGARYYRTRWIQQSTINTAKVIRRSEPSTSSAQFTPSGSGASVTVTRTATALGEGETHWEVEASTDNATFYRIATVVVGTTTYSDTLNATGISTAGPSSEAIGAYLLQPAARYLTVDNDRLIGAGHTYDPARQSLVWFGPTGGDPGVGNGERLPISTTGGQAISSSVTLDNNVGGPITGLASGLLQPQYASTASPTSIVYVFKWQRIYMLIGTGVVTGPYQITTVSSRRGAVPDSVFIGIDEGGNPAVYFLDPLFGPSRITQQHGIETLPGIRTTWGRVNLSATDVIACGLYYPFKRQAMWWVSVDGGNTPALRIKYQVGETGHVSKSAQDFVRGWTIDDSRLAQARCCCTYTEYVSNNGTVNLSIRPVIGLTAPDYVQRTDVDTTDAGQPYVATILSRPYNASGLLQKWGTMGVSLLADAQASGTLNLFVIRDFGLETFGPYPMSTLATSAGELKVMADLDNAAQSGARFFQFEFTDSSTVVLS